MSVNVIDVSQINAIIKGIIDSEENLKNIFVRGEISNFTNHLKSGHFYFTLKDEKSLVKAIMFNMYAKKLRFAPQSGMKVIVRCSVKVFERDGIYQLYVEEMQPDGLGALNMAYEQLKEKLFQEGLFAKEKKKPIPQYPDTIGIITAQTGAAIQDIYNILTRRYSLAKLYLYPVLVQGASAAEQMIKAIEYFNNKRIVSTIIIGRGGGSIEDLWAFNDEQLARAISNSSVPIISAVGHETDFTIADFVADLRAPTPSAAAELAVRDVASIMYDISTSYEKMFTSVNNKLTNLSNILDGLMTRRCLSDNNYIINTPRHNLEIISDKLRDSYMKNILAYKEELASYAGKIDAMSPLKVLSRGYTVILKDGSNISSVHDVEEGSKITVKMIDGCFNATVTDINN